MKTHSKCGFYLDVGKDRCKLWWHLLSAVAVALMWCGTVSSLEETHLHDIKVTIDPAA